MSIQKTCQQVFAACFGLSLFVGLESKASAYISNDSYNYVNLEVVNAPSGQFNFSALVNDSNAFAGGETVQLSGNGTATSDALVTAANYLYWAFSASYQNDEDRELPINLSQNAINAGFYINDDSAAETNWIPNTTGGSNAYLSFDYNTITLDANIEQSSNPQPVPEPNGGLGALTLGALGASYLLSKQLKKQKSI